MAADDDSAATPLDVFISYARPDVAWTLWLAALLESAGYTTRYQYRDFRVGENFVAQIDAALAEAQAVALILSEPYRQSTYTRQEWTAAYNDETRTIPIRVDDAVPPPLLNSLTWLDLRNLDEKKATAAVQERLRELQPGVEPSRYNPDRLEEADRPAVWFPGRRHPIPLGATSMLDRRESLEAVAEAMAEPHGPVVIVPDPPGASRGSTALAASYVQHFAASYDTVHWLAANPPELLPLEFARVGRELELPRHARNRDGVYAALAAQHGSRALVVIDDVPWSGTMQPWLPDDGQRALLTASDDTYDHLPNVRLGPLQGEAVRDHLAAASGTSEAEVEKINERLDGDPIAVALASRWLRATREPPEAYLRALEEAGGDDASECAARASVLALREASSEAFALLLVLGRAAHRPFPLQAFRRAGASPQKAIDPVLLKRRARDAGLQAMAQFGIATEAEGMVAVVGSAARAAASLADEGWVESAAAGLARALTRSLAAARGEGDLALGDALVGHAYAVLHPTDGIPPPPEHAAELGLELTRAFLEAGADDLAADALAQLDGLPDLAPDHRAERALLGAQLDERTGDTARAAGALEGAASDATVSAKLRAMLLARLGALRAKLGDGLAQQAFDRAERMAVDNRQWMMALDVLGLRGEAERRAGDFEAALATAGQRLDGATKYAGVGPAVSEAHGDRGLAHLALGDPTAAADDLIAALATPAARSPERVAELAEGLAEAHLGAGNTEEARTVLGRAGVELAGYHGRRALELAPIMDRIAATYDLSDSHTDALRATELRNRAARLRGQEPDPVAGCAPLDAHLQRVVNGKCIPIIGPRFTDRVFTPRRLIAKNWAEHEDHRYPMAEFHKEDLPHVAQYLSIRMGPKQFRRAMEKYFLDRLRQAYHESLSPAAREVASTEPGATYRVIAEAGAVARWIDPFEYHAVLARLDCEVYVSTGPAGLLSAALVDAGKRPIVVSCNWLDDRSPGAPPGFANVEGSVERPLVLHLFGDFRDPGSVLLAERDYLDFVIRYSKASDRVPPAVNHALVNSSLLFLGFDLDEWDFNVLLQGFVNQPGLRYSDGLPHAAVQIDSKATWEDAEAARQYLMDLMSEQRNVRVFFKELDKLMIELAVARAGREEP